MFFRENRDKDGGFYDAGLWVERFGGEMQMQMQMQSRLFTFPHTRY